MSTPRSAPAHLASIHIYPMKGCRAVDLAEAAVEPWGLAGDRRWLLVDTDGRFISQREEPALARLVITYVPGDDPATPEGIRLASAGFPGLCVPVPRQGTHRQAASLRSHQAAQPELLKVTVWSSVLLAAAAGAAADAWFSAYLRRPVRLVYLDDPTRRPVDPEYGADGDVVSFADGYPLLLTSASSLAELGDWLRADGEQPVPMTRFRPNVVIEGAGPWAEDRWRRIRIGTVAFRVAKPCGRCVVTTIDQLTGERGTQPLTILGRYRRSGQQLVFGQNLIPDGPGVIRAGDNVEISERAA